VFPTQKKESSFYENGICSAGGLFTFCDHLYMLYSFSSPIGIMLLYLMNTTL
jgi:hypothetical protein